MLPLRTREPESVLTQTDMHEGIEILRRFWYTIDKEGSIRMGRNHYVAGLDVGTTKTCAVVGERNPDGGITILGMGEAVSKGLHKGVVVNLERTIHSATAALEAAEESSRRKIRSVFVGVAGAHIWGINSRGMTGVSRKDQEITLDDVDRAVDNARAVKLPPDRKVLHVFPQGYIVDGHDGVNEPIGMLGVRLEADVHIVTGGTNSVQNLAKCVNRAGFGVAEVLLEPYASGEAVLTEDEQELGVAIVNIGGGTTGVVVFQDSTIRHSRVLPLGGNHVTADVAVGLRTPQRRAEQIKKRCGCAIQSLVHDDEMVTVPGVGGREDRQIPRRDIVDIIEPRMDEILRLVFEEFENSGMRDRIPAGVVMTGGGSLLPGTIQMAESIFKCPVRLGTPRNFDGNGTKLKSPAYATSLGLVKYGIRLHEAGKKGGMDEPGKLESLYNSVKDWFLDHF